MKKEAIIIASKHNNSLETFLYPIRKNLAMHQFDFTLQMSTKSLRDQYKLVSEGVKKTLNLQNSKNKTKNKDKLEQNSNLQ